MSIKKTRLISILGIFLISFLAHFMYDLFPNVITSFFFPVNESIWEHMKILFTSTMIYGVFDYILMKRFNIKYNNLLLELFITSFLSVIIYLIIYIPIYLLYGENLIVSIILMIITYIITKYIGYYILIQKEYRLLNIISIFLIIMCYLGFIYLTYNPIHNFIFYDTVDRKYGVREYVIE